MASMVDICSNALLMLGASPLNAFDEDSDRARLAANLWPVIRDMVLRSHPWNCAIKRVQLAPETGKPAFGWQRQFVLPADCLRVLNVANRHEYELEGRFILANAMVLNLRYVFRNEVVGSWDSLLVHAMTACMRVAFAYPVTEKTTLEQLVTQTLQPILKQARAIDGQENPPETLGNERLYWAGF